MSSCYWCGAYLQEGEKVCDSCKVASNAYDINGVEYLKVGFLYKCYYCGVDIITKEHYKRNQVLECKRCMDGESNEE